MPFRVARTACLIGAACLVAGSPLAIRAGAPDAVIARLVALPLSDRASLLVELKTPVPLARETRSDAQSVVVEAGPIDGDVQALNLTPAATTPLLGDISIASFTAANGQAFLRITVQLRAPASHRVRLAGSRIYVDLAPLPVRPRPGDLNAARDRPAPASPTGAPPVAPPASALAPNAPAGAASGASGPSAPSGTPGVGATQTPAPSPASDEALDAAYRALQTDVLKRAGTLAPRADVKGLLALVEETKRRDDQLGRTRPGVVEKMLEEINRKLEEARILRLQLDAEAFEKQDRKRTDTPR